MRRAHRLARIAGRVGGHACALPTLQDATYSFPGLKSSLGAAGAAMPSGRGPCGRRRRRGKRSPPPAAFIPAGRAIHLRLRAGDEGGQAIDAAGIGNHRLRLGLRLILRLRTMLALAMMFARLLVALVGLAVAALLARIVVADEGLLLLRDEARLLAEMREALALVVAVFRRRRFRCRCAVAAGSAGTAPGRRRSGGNNVRRAGSNSRPRPDRRKSARRAPAGRIFPQRGRRCRGS